VEWNRGSGVYPDEPRVQILPNALSGVMEAGSSRLQDVWKRRKGTILWSAVAVLAVVVAVVIGVQVLPGATTPPHHFAFTFFAPACGCAKFAQTTYAFPTQSTIRFSWWVTWIGNNATAQLAIDESDGTPVFLSVSEYQQGNQFDPNTTWGQGGAGTFSGHGTPFTFGVEVIGVTDFLPPDTTVWINGTYTTPLL